MPTLYPLRRIALLLAAVVLITGCDGFESGTPPDQVSDTEVFVNFASAETALTEDQGPLQISVTLNIPSGQPLSQPVEASILYANDISETDPADFNLPDDAAIGTGNGYVAGRVEFGTGAEDGATQSIDLDVQDDDENEEQEEGIFALQQVRNATIGDQGEFTVQLGALQVFFATFGESGDPVLDPFSTFSVASGNDWSASEEGTGDPYARVNGFGASEPSNDWLIAPALDFNTLTAETLTFRNARNFEDNGLEFPFRVKVSTDYSGSGTPENATWIDVTDQVQNFSSGGFEFVNSGEIDLSGDNFQSDATYIAFQYLSSGTGSGSSAIIEIDDVTVTSTTPLSDGSE
jgi:hypothetical protein